MDFLKNHLIMNARWLVDHFQSSLFGWVQQQTQQKVMSGNGQLTKVHS